jgi:hypothetical protein
MHKQSSKSDFAQNALRVVEISTGEPLKPKAKNAAAVALGRLGGLKGGPRRKELLTDARLSEIAQKAAIARWAKAKRVRIDVQGS